MTPNFQRTVNLYRNGQFEAAESVLRSLLEAEPRHADALQLAGLLAMQGGRAAEALGFWRRSLIVNPRQPAVYLNMSSAELKLGRPQAALECCEAALNLRPGYADALTNRGRALQQLGRSDAALASFDEAVRLRPDEASASTARANLLMEMLRPLEALEDYERVCQASPHDWLAAFNRGLALEMARRFDAAVAAFDAALERAPGFAEAHQHRGNSLRALGRHAEALESHLRAIATHGGAYVDALCGAGDALRELGRLQEALVHYERALALDPQHLDGLTNCGRALLALRRPAEAVERLERAFQAAPAVARRHNYALGHLLHARLCCCDWRDYDATVARVAEAVLEGERVTLPSLCLVSSGASRVQLACARRFAADNWRALETLPPSPSSGGGAKHKVRIAYVSADFRQHPVASLLVSLIETHDRERFEIFGVSLRSPDSSPLGERIRAAFDRCIDVAGMSDRAAVEMLRGLKVDVGVDLNGYTDGFRAGLFARRFAPVQVNFLGYTGTLGAPYIDYVIADDMVIPEGQPDCFVEKVVRLSGCYLPGDASRPPVSPMQRLAAGLPEHGFVFCCFNNHYKLNPRMFNAWMRMLDAVEGSVLWLAGAGEPIVGNLRGEAARRGVAPERLLFAPRLPDHGAHLARIAAADLFLDTLPFNAHTTAAEALWAGLPVLTCLGSSFAGRVGGSLVTAAGLPEMVTENVEAYEALGIYLARTPEVLISIRNKMLTVRSSAPLYDDIGYRRNLETAFEIMADRARRGLAPQGFSV